MKAPSIACAALLAVLGPLGCEKSRDGGSSPAPLAPTPAPEDSPAPDGDPQPASGGIGLSGGGTGPAPSTPPTPSAASASAAGDSIDWSTVAPAGQRAARDALYGIIRIIDLERAEDSGHEILSFAPGAGPQDTEATVYSPITVHSATYHVDESMWLGLFNMVQSRQDDNPAGFMARPLPDSRYGDGETSARADLLFALVVDDADRKSLKISWQRQ